MEKPYTEMSNRERYEAGGTTFFGPVGIFSPDETGWQHPEGRKRIEDAPLINARLAEANGGICPEELMYFMLGNPTKEEWAEFAKKTDLATVHAG